MIDKSQSDLNFSNSYYFQLCPPWSISVALLFFEVSISIFCVLIKQCQSLHNFFFEFLLRQSYDPSWELQSCAVPSCTQSSNYFSKPPLWVLRCESANSVRRSLRIICFRNFSWHSHAPPLKLLVPPPLPVSITRLFLKASSSSYLVLDRSFSKFLI